ncbi:MAG: Gfo/Idh/MocA family protein [Christensenellales bacterium]|jgi:UDP-N-acetyl-2-amino-2-deoxyglucuronate dehydrogenase
MNNRRIRTALVGCGKVADFHALAYAGLENSEFVACCDSDIERARSFAEKYNIKAYDNTSKMIRDSKVEMLSICTPHPLHASIAVEAANEKCNVLVEKPLAVSLDDCNKIIQAGEQNQVKIGMIAQRRFYRPCMRIKQAIEDGKIGTPIIGTVNVYGWRSKEYYESDPWRGTWKGEGGGVMATQATHQIDLLLWYMGEIEEVYGIWKNYNHPYIEVEDTALAIVKFKNGAVGNLVMSNSQNPALFGNVRVHGSNGASLGVQTDGGSMFIAGMSEITEAPYNDIWTVQGEADNLEQMRKEDTEEFFRVDSMYHYHRVQIAEFIDSILQDRQPLVTAHDGMKAVELMIAVYQSTETGLPVKFPLKA